MYDSAIQSFFLNCDTSTTHQITTAPTMKLSEEVLSPIRTSIIRARGPLFQFLTEGSLQNTTGSKANRTKLASTKKGIENFLTGSLLEIRPLSINKLQGLRCKVATVDEWLSGDLREDPIGAIEQGASKIDDYLIVATSSEGTVRNGSGDTIKMELMKILKGEYENPHVSIWYYRLDEIEEVGDPYFWIKANPNLGKTVSYETYQLDVERAENAPAARNDILAKRFGIPMEGYTYFFTYDTIACTIALDGWSVTSILLREVTWIRGSSVNMGVGVVVMVCIISCTCTTNKCHTSIEHITTINNGWHTPVTCIDGFQEGAACEHLITILHLGHVKAAQVKTLQTVTIMEHGIRICDVIRLETTYVKVRQARAIIEHTVHTRHVVRLEVFYALYCRQIATTEEPIIGTSQCRAVCERLIKDDTCQCFALIAPSRVNSPYVIKPTKCERLDIQTSTFNLLVIIVERQRLAR